MKIKGKKKAIEILDEYMNKYNETLGANYAKKSITLLKKIL